mmetsp:Transcript_20035/g.36026  ORF Transcript_20035/g.36026 Transcript_20035/m.36026 type:complete len:191 (-) Transcript_20035:581-1153(-)
MPGQFEAMFHEVLDDDVAIQRYNKRRRLNGPSIVDLTDITHENEATPISGNDCNSSSPESGVEFVCVTHSVRPIPHIIGHGRSRMHNNRELEIVEDIDVIDVERFDSVSTAQRTSHLRSPPSTPELVYQCPICYSKMNKPASGKCGHLFCYSCLEIWLRQNLSCPKCRKRMNVRDVHRVYLPTLVPEDDS